jgi:hypothetical protein
VAHNQGYEIIIDGVSSATIPEYLCETIERQLTGENRDQVELIPGREGGWLVPEYPGMKEIKILSHILSDNFPIDRRAAVRSVANWVDTPGFVKMICEDEPGVFNWVKLSESPMVTEWRELGSFELILDFQCHR